MLQDGDLNPRPIINKTRSSCKLVERLSSLQKVSGSIPHPATIFLFTNDVHKRLKHIIAKERSRSFTHHF